MAQKKSTKKSSSRAEKAVSSANKKSAAQKAAAEKKKNAKKIPEEKESVITHNGAVSLVTLCLFVLFLIIAIRPEGKVLLVMRSIVWGLIGKVGFYFSIPVLLFVSFIHTFGKKNALFSRTFSAVVFMLMCGSFYHLLVQTQGHAEGMAIIRDLYEGGSYGEGGGLICGGLMVFSDWAIGRLGSFVVTILIGAMAALGINRITIPGLVRAFKNRPRDTEWDDEEDEEFEEPEIEPAVAVVNHIANKHIEHQRERRQKLKEAREQAAALPQPPTVSDECGRPANAKSMLDAMDQDISSPMGGGEEAYYPEEKTRATRRAQKKLVPDDDIPETMPQFHPEDIAPPSFVTRNPEPEEVYEEPPQPVKPLKPVMVEKPEPAAKPKKKESIVPEEDIAAEIQSHQAQEDHPAYCFPPIDLLKRPTRAGVDGTDEMRENSQRLNETLASFHIDAHITNVTRGPSVTRYEVELDKGVRLSKLTGCADDIALSLGASGVRIAAVPGKISIVGIEVPNRSVTMVSLREVIDSPEFSRAKGKSSFAVGKDIGGSCIVGNIAKMPHLLIAGTTGSGKSVCMNSIILSLLYKAGPEDVKLIMVVH